MAQVYQFVATKLAGAQEITQVTLDGKEYPLTVADAAIWRWKRRTLRTLRSR